MRNYRNGDAAWGCLLVAGIIIIPFMVYLIYCDLSYREDFKTKAVNYIFNAEQIPLPGTVIYQDWDGKDVIIQFDNIELGWFTIKAAEGEVIKSRMYSFPDEEARKNKTKTRFAGKMLTGESK